MRRVCVLAPAHSIHTERWVAAMAARGYDVHLISAHSPRDASHLEVEFHRLRFPPPTGYLLNASQLGRLLNRLKPDFVHAHYATSYGLLARLSVRSPLLLSVWGSDVLLFPHRSRWSRRLVVKNLECATVLTATSPFLASAVRGLIGSERRVEVVPFGVDCERFRPPAQKTNASYVIGTLKGLERKYGVDRVLEAFALARQRGIGDARLVIAGEGRERENLVHHARHLGIHNVVSFLGQVPHRDVPDLLRGFDVFARLSRSEGFGVSVLEASACGVIPVVSDAGGLPEVVDDGTTGFVVPDGDSRVAAERFIQLANDRALRVRMASAGREMVKTRYGWQESVDRMERVYQQMPSSN